MSQTKAQLISDLVQALNFTGTASAPANGLFLSASNQLKLATASTERLKIDGTEVVVNDTGADVDFRIESDTNTHAIFLNAGNSRVGINTASPSDALHVTGNISVTSGDVLITDAHPSVRFTDTDAPGGYGHVGVNNTSGSLVLRSDDGNALSGTFMGFEIDGSPKMTLDGTGLGIGTSSPSTALHINMGSGGLPKIRLQHTSAGNDVFEITGGLAGVSNGGFGIYDVDESAYRLAIDSSGNVGIGTTSPGALLHVKTTTSKTDSVEHMLILEHLSSGTTTTGVGTGIRFRGERNNGVMQNIGDINFEADVNSGSNISAALVFKPALSGVTTERMRIDSSGRVGIGVTTANDTATALTIKNMASGSEHTILEIICDDNETSRVTFSETSTLNNGSIRYSFTSDLRAMTFHTNGSGSDSERMRITSGGNLLIGTTTSEDTTGNSGPKVINTGDITIDGNRKALVFRSTQSTAHQMSGIQWWNEIGAGVQCAIHGIREAVNKAPGALAFYTSNDVDTSSNNGEGEITEAMRIDSNQRILLGTTVSEDTTGNSGTKVISGGDITIDGDQKAFIFRSSASAAQIQSGIQWWNENGAGVMAKIHCIRSAINNAPGDLAFFTNTDVDTTANNSEGDITERMRILSSGEVDIYSAYTNPVGGTTRDLYVRSDGRLGYLSSIRASKTNIVDLTDISWLNNLKPKAFNIRKKNDSGEYTDNYYDELEYGLIAEDVESVNKELCSYSSDNALEAVQYRKLVVPLLKAVQELTARVAALEAA